MARFVSDYSKEPDLALDDMRFRAPSFERNHLPIGDCLAPYFDGRSGDVLEIGSGPGQHAVGFARRFPDLVFWPTDPVQAHLDSIAAWTRFEGLRNVRPPMPLDASADDWLLGEPGRPKADGLMAILAINVLHIAPFSVTEGLFRSAGAQLGPDGILAIYGPFMENGKHVAPSNADFDISLRAQDDQWGIRDTSDLDRLAEAAGLEPAERATMPANNFTLVYRLARSG